MVPVPRFQIDRVSWRFRRLAMTSLPTGIRTPQSRHSCLFSFTSPHRLHHCHLVLTGAYLLTIDSWAAFIPRISVYTLNNTTTICFVAVTLRGKSFARRGTSQSVCHSGPNNPHPHLVSDSSIVRCLKSGQIIPQLFFRTCLPVQVTQLQGASLVLSVQTIYRPLTNPIGYRCARRQARSKI